MKVALVSTILPSGHFSEILCKSIQNHSNIDLMVYADNNPENIKNPCRNVKNVWDRGPIFIFGILRTVLEEKPDVVHVQQELNMYGGALTILIFPILLLFLKLLRVKVVTTIHAAVYKEQIDNDFIKLFLMKSIWYIRPFTLKLIFHILFLSISILSDRIICHSGMMKDILTKDYNVASKKIQIIRTTIPVRKNGKNKRKKYFLYFGYIVRRKGIEQLIEGFEKFSKKNKDFNLILAGGTIPGQEKAREEISQKIESLNLEKRVTMTGFIDHKTIEQLYQNAYAAVMPARISMGSSGPLYHAQSYGICILASDIGHFKEDIINMKDGILVPSNSWYQALKKIASDPKLVKRIEFGVKIKAQQKLPHIIAKQYDEMYKKVINL